MHSETPDVQDFTDLGTRLVPEAKGYTLGSSMKTAKFFQNGQIQAARLPKEFRLPCESVYIKKQRNAVVLIPQIGSWDCVFESLDKFSEDYMGDREQPESQERDVAFR